MTDLPRIVYHGRDELLDPELEWSNPEAVSDPVALVLKEDFDTAIEALKGVASWYEHYKDDGGDAVAYFGIDGIHAAIAKAEERTE